MNALPLLGAGAVLAWAGLPLLACVVGRESAAVPGSRFRALLIAFALGASLFAVPFARARIDRLRSVWLPVEVERGALPVRAALRAGAERAAEPLAWIGGGWLLLCALGLARLAARTFHSGWLARGRAELPPALVEVADRLARELGIAPPRLIVSRRAALPFVTAVPRTTVVVPESFLASLGGEDMALVLRHELTHLARGDHQTAVAIELLKVPFTLHPTAARLCRELGLAREMAVDGRVGAVAPSAYAHLLVDVAEIHRFGTREAGEVALEPSSLERRIEMLTRPAPHREARLLPTLLLASALAAASFAIPASEAAASVVSDAAAFTIPLGGTVRVEKPDIIRISIGSPEIIDVDPVKGAAIVYGVGPGRTTLLIWTKDQVRHIYTVTVK